MQMWYSIIWIQMGSWYIIDFLDSIVMLHLKAYM